MRYETIEDEAKGRRGVKQYVSWIRGPYTGFQVYETGDPQYYWFQVTDLHGVVGSLGWPVLKSELDPELRSKLRRGLGQIPEPLPRPKPED